MADTISLADPFTVTTRYWHRLDDGRLQCDACPRACKLREGQRGVCFVRGRIDDQVVLTSYGRSSGYCVDPIEKKPLNHFLPGTSVLSFGTAGCNLACRFCQNWDISKSKEIDRHGRRRASRRPSRRPPSSSAARAWRSPTTTRSSSSSTPSTPRRPAASRACRSVAVSAGYATEAAGRELYAAIDAANIDLKGFTDEFYRHVAMGELAPVLDTLELHPPRDRHLAGDHHPADPRAQRLRRRAARDGGVDRRPSWARRSRCTSAPSTPTTRCSTCRHPARDAHPGPPHRPRRRPALRLHRQRARPRGRHHACARRAAPR